VPPDPDYYSKQALALKTPLEGIDDERYGDACGGQLEAELQTDCQVNRDTSIQ